VIHEALTNIPAETHAGRQTGRQMVWSADSRGEAGLGNTLQGHRSVTSWWL